MLSALSYAREAGSRRVQFDFRSACRKNLGGEEGGHTI
jgi:hypothetical protein